MNIKRKNKSAYRIKFLAGAIISYAFFSIFYHVRAASISDISNECNIILDDDQQKKCEVLQKKEEMYKSIIEIKEKQGESLNNQLSITDSNIRQVQTQIDLSSQQIDDLNSQIIRLEKQISEKDLLIKSQKDLLADLVQLYYEVNQAGPVAAYLSDGNIASFVVKKDRIAQTGDRIKDLVDSIMEIKKEFQQQNAQLDQKKSEVVDTNQKLQDKSADLTVIKKQRQALLTQTQGEEAKYRKLLQKIQEQKNQLLDIDQYFAASGLSADSYPKPASKYFASTSWFYYQWDSRWGNETIGNTKTLMKSYGCAVTAVAMVLNEHGGSINPGKLANQPIFYGDLINWPATWSNPKLSLSADGKSHGNISWSVVDAQIAKGNPVIVYIKKSNGGGGHYVVVHHKDAKGKYVVHDPYFGANIFLDTSRALIGAMGKSSSTSIDQMIIYN
jgi:peptidoglycan hydrolase CwlO-like protein